MIQDKVLLNDWHPVGLSMDLIDNAVTRVRLLEEDLVMWRTGGQVCVWKDLCIHRGAQLSRGRVEHGNLICPYHGWEYGTSGACTKYPAHPEQTPSAKAKAITYPVKERYGFIWTCLGTPEHDLIDFPEYDDPSYRKVFCGPYTVNASASRIVENGLDVAHFPFVHEGILATRDRAEIADYPVESDKSGVVVRDIRFWQTDRDGTGKPGEASYNFWMLRPFTLMLRKDADGSHFCLLQVTCPIDQYHTIFYSCVAMDYGHDVPEQEIIAFQDRVLAQDFPVIESQRPELLPLDLQEELHLRCDKASIAYRRWLKDLGVTFGTA